jgi:uncharacterized protein (UPF0254 family)
MKLFGWITNRSNIPSLKNNSSSLIPLILSKTVRNSEISLVSEIFVSEISGLQRLYSKKLPKLDLHFTK